MSQDSMFHPGGRHVQGKTHNALITYYVTKNKTYLYMSYKIVGEYISCGMQSLLTTTIGLIAVS
jgi:hypothetical protein